MKRTPLARKTPLKRTAMKRSSPKRSSGLRREAQGRPCLVRLPGCDGGGDTTVLAHYRLAGTCGTGMKPQNWQGAWCCWHCHEIVDGRIQVAHLSSEYIKLAFAEGVLRTIGVIMDYKGELV
jgi:hypothetical protein